VNIVNKIYKEVTDLQKYLQKLIFHDLWGVNFSRFCTNVFYALHLCGFDYQERNLTYVRTDFQVSKLKFQSVILSRLAIFFINYIYIYS